MEIILRQQQQQLQQQDDLKQLHQEDLKQQQLEWSRPRLLILHMKKSTKEHNFKSI